MIGIAKKKNKTNKSMLLVAVLLLVAVALVVFNSWRVLGFNNVPENSGTQIIMCQNYLKLDSTCSKNIYDQNGVARKLAEGVQEICMKIPAYASSCATPSFECVKACCSGYGC